MTRVGDADRRRAAAAVLWLAAVAAVFGAAGMLRYDPAGGVRLPGGSEPLPEICMMRRVFGIECPGCGLTRSFILAARGRFAAAGAMHPIGLALFAALAAQIPVRVHQLARFVRGRPVYPTGRWELTALVALLVGLWLWWPVRFYWS